MNIGYDAKRAFLNRSGLGHYSRDTIRVLMTHQPGNNYFLFTPRDNNDLFRLSPAKNITVVTPGTIVQRLIPSYWRSISLSSSINRHRIDIYHGLSNELPADIKNARARTVVTIHDLIFLRYPGYYNVIDRNIYLSKFRRSSEQADIIVAISHQTRLDLMEYLNISNDKIRVVYQGCNTRFYSGCSDEEKRAVAEKYGLPLHFLLTVGTVEERKNLLALVKAIHMRKIEYPLVVVGRPTSYAGRVKEYIARQGINRVFFLENIPFGDLPALYQMADIFIYPSVYEGFGIPILEALVSGVPVITNRTGCFREAGGTHSCYIDPSDPLELGDAIIRLLENEEERKRMIREGKKHAQLFSDESIAANMAAVYNYLM